MLEELIQVLFQVKSKAVAKLVINMPTDVSTIRPLPNGLARFLASSRKSKKAKADISCIPLAKKVAMTTNGRHSTCVDS